jgi:hypothetical protein
MLSGGEQVRVWKDAIVLFYFGTTALVAKQTEDKHKY